MSGRSVRPTEEHPPMSDRSVRPTEEHPPMSDRSVRPTVRTMPVRSIAIIGSGAVGGYYGGRLAQHGRAVHFLLRSDYGFVREHGLRVRSIAGDFSLSRAELHLYNDPAAMPTVDLVI